MISTAPNAVANMIFESRAHEFRAQAALERQSRTLPPRYLLFVGRLVPEKGIDDLMHAYEALDGSLKSELSLVIVGDGPLRRDLKSRAAQLARGSVKIAGFVQRDELAAYYAFAEMFVFPTYTDTWGLVVNEAMACGLPVIASSAAGCVADLVLDGWNGRVVNRGRVPELAAAISQLAKDPELRTMMGCRSREIISRYSPECCAAGMALAALNCGVLQHD
jgi:glycosyltransferase involved in cell wall biosynthesis